jgi:hypothetical protein
LVAWDNERLQGPEGFHRVRIGDDRMAYLIEDRVLHGE